uniref:Uncharacterized protein n=1 Tax=Aegilops tauschii subsp. strangulata TaxID=200361 RepID=A0A453L419_AEGTS
ASTFPTPTLLTPKLSQPPLGPSRRNAAAAAAPWPHRGRISATTGGEAAAAAEAKARKEQRKRCLRCGALYLDEDNSAAACAFHGHITGRYRISTTYCCTTLQHTSCKISSGCG